MTLPKARERLILWLLLALTFAIRAIHPDQPIVENYVGRQIPTAMVARNLERGSGFLHPQLDTGPFPNLFLVEPPIYAQVVVAARPLLGFDLESTGRLVSAAGTVLGAWGLFGLVRRREGALPLDCWPWLRLGCSRSMIRYGRAFQPDALMVGCVLAGLRGWDEYEAGGSWRWSAFGGFVLAIGLALKITVAWALIPFVLILRRWPIGRRLIASASMLIPSLAWYLYAWGDVTRPGSGSLASFDNASLWFHTLSPEAWLRFSTYENLARGLVVRSFTPVGFVLAIWGFAASSDWWRSGWPGSAVLRNPGLPSVGQSPDRGCGVPQTPATRTLATQGPTQEPTSDGLWLGWGIGCCLAIFGLASKWHHAYYWMVVAPLAAVGVARGLVSLRKLGRYGLPVAASLGSFFLGLCLVQSASTWRTPAEGAWLKYDAGLIALRLGKDNRPPFVAPEVLIYYANRPGCRLEFDPKAVRRAAGEWGRSIESPEEPLALVNFYRELLAPRSEFKDPDWVYVPPFHVADAGLAFEGSRRKAFRDALRASPDYHVLVDAPSLIIAEAR